MSLTGIISSGLGLASSIFGERSAQKQQNEILDRMMRINQQNFNEQKRIAQPYLDAGLQGIRTLRNYVGELNTQRFNTNPYYDQARATGLASANRQEAQSKKSTAYAFGSNEGRSRGEQNRIGRQYISAKNQIHFDWARMTESERMQRTQQYLTGISYLNNAGYTGSNLMTNAYNNYTQNAMNIEQSRPTYSPLSTIGGQLMDYGFHDLFSQNDLFAQENDIFNNLGNENGGNKNNTTGYNDLMTERRDIATSQINNPLLKERRNIVTGGRG